MHDNSETTIWIEELDPPHVRLSWTHYPWQNATHIKRRAAQLAVKYANGWHCARCENVMPVWKRLDARYCCESCRKLAARARRAS